jgi:hypothetical protein
MGTRHLDWARRYRTLGCHPVPVLPGTKRPAVDWKPYQVEPPSDAQITAWWTDKPNAGVALVMGRGAFAVDLDGGDAAVQLLREAGVTLPANAPRSRTGGGGYHVLQRGTVNDAVAIIKDDTREHCQVDIRGKGIIVVPPTIHPSGTPYQWDVAPVEVAQLPEPPPGLLALMGPITTPEPSVSSGAGWVAEALRGVGKGQRADTCVRLAGYFLGRGLPHENVTAILQTGFAAQCHPPFPSADVAATVASIAQREAGRGAGVDGGDREQRILAEVERERARREARRRLDAEERGTIREPDVATLRDRLARPRPAIKRRINRWQSCNTRNMLVAQYKAGKTTFVDNVIRSLVDGDLFLGVDDVTPIVGNVALLDFEMGPTQLDDWLRDQRMRHDDRVVIYAMRGQASAFNLLDDGIRATWVRRFRERGISYPIIDCLRPILDALGLDEHHDAGRFLTAYDALLKEAGIPESLIVQHMGHANERARGDSRLQDWPDATWRLVRENEEPNSRRFISAYGRDVDVHECELAFDATTRRLTIAGGSRHDARTQDALDVVCSVLATEGSPLSGRQVKGKLAGSDLSRDTIDKALAFGTRNGTLQVSPGDHRAKLYRLSECPAVSGSVRPLAPDTGVQCPPPLIEADTRTLKSDTQVSGSGSDDGHVGLLDAVPAMVTVW